MSSRRTIAGSVVVCVLAIAACANSDGESTSDPSGPSPAAPPTEEAERAEDERADGERTDAVAAATSVVDDSAPESVDSTPVTAEVAESEPRFVAGESDELFDQNVVHTFEIDLADEALAELDADPAAEEYVEGSLTFDGETIEPVGIRYKGSIGAFLGCTAGPNPMVPSGPKTCSKLSIKLKINWDGADTEFFGQRRVQLHAMNLDSSMMRERLGYSLFAAAGVPTPRATHARVVVNGEFVGLFALVEQIDGRFTRDRFDDGKGNLYKEVWPFDSEGAVQARATLVEGLETNEDDDPPTDIVQSFAQEILDSGATSDPEAARRVISERTDLDAFVAYAVVDRAINHDDGPFHWYCVGTPCSPHNFYVYEEPEDDTVSIIPWDLDTSLQGFTPETLNPITAIADDFGEISNDCEPFAFGALGLAQRSAACDPLVAAWALLDDEFEQADADFRSGPFSIEEVAPLVETWREQIAPIVAEAAAADPTAVPLDEWNASVDRLLADIAAEPSRQDS